MRTIERRVKRRNEEKVQEGWELRSFFSAKWIGIPLFNFDYIQ